MKKTTRFTTTIALTAALIALLIPMTAMSSRADEAANDQTKADLAAYYDDASAFLATYGDELPNDIYVALDTSRSQAYPVIGTNSADAHVTAISNLRIQLEVAEAYMEGRQADTSAAPHHVMGTAAANLNGVNGVSADTANTVASIYSSNRNLPGYMIRAKVVENFVDRLYMDILGRHADAQSSKTYTDGIINGTMTANDVINSLLNCSEFNNRNLTNEQFVKVLYNAFLDRSADTAGLNNWVNALNNGTTRAQLAQTFSGLQAWNNLCAFYGIDD